MKSDLLRKSLKYFLSTAIIILTAAMMYSGAFALSIDPANPNPDTQVILRWNADSTADHYEILNGSTGALIDTVNVNSLNYCTYTVKGLTPGTGYTFKIVPSSPAGQLPLLDNTITVTTSNVIKAYNVSANYNINTGVVTLAWNGSLAWPLHNVVRGSNGNDHDAGSSSNSLSFPENATGSQVAYTVITSYGTNPPAKSDPVTITPISPPQVTASVSNGTAHISWGTFDQLAYFNLESQAWTGSTWGPWGSVPAPLSGTGINYIPGNGGSYRYRLTAYATSPYLGSSYLSETVNIPKAPTGLNCSVINGNNVNLTWTPDIGNQSPLQVYRKRSTDSAYTLITTLPYSAASYTDTFPLVIGTTYQYKITAYDTPSNTSDSTPVSVTSSAPVAPANLSITMTSTSAIELNWTDNNTSETGYIIERSINSGAYSQLVGNLAANTTSYDDTGLTPGQTYSYRIMAVNNLGNSPYSNVVSINMAQFVALNSLTATAVSSTEIDLAWTYPGSGSYRTVIERRTGASGTWTQVYTSSSGILRYSDIGLTPNAQYFYRVKNYLGPGIMTAPYPSDSTGVDAVTKLSGLTLSGSASTGNQIYLSWTGSDSNSDVVIERKMANGSYAVLATMDYAAAGWYDNSGLVPGATYTYRIKAKNAANESVYSNEIAIVNTYLNAPSSLTLSTDQDAGIDLAWTDNSTNETGFEIWRMVYGASAYTLIDTVGQNTVKYTDKTAKSGVQYNYMVRAYMGSAGIYSAYSNTASIGIGMIPPPTDLKYSYVSSSQVLLTWTDASSNESGFNVEKRVGEEGDWTDVAWLSQNTTSCTVTGLDQYTIYYFRIRAYSYTGNIDSLSDEIEVSTALPYAPTGVTATAVSSSQVNIKWLDNSDTESGFRIMRKASSLGYITVAEVGANVTSYSDKNLTSGVTYTYKVAAFNGSGSNESGEVSAKTTTKATFSDLGSVSWAKEAIEELAGRGVIKGATPTKYVPNNKITRAEFVSLMMRAFSLQTTPVGSMADVKVANWFYKDVMTAEYYGIVSPNASNKFYPNRAITREEIAVIICRTLEAAGKPLNGYPNSVLEKFWDKDLISSSALASMASVVGDGVMSGVTTTSVGPENAATRAEAAAFIYRIIGR